jgi:hypothetical protein
VEHSPVQHGSLEQSANNGTHIDGPESAVPASETTRHTPVTQASPVQQLPAVHVVPAVPHASVANS